MALTRQRRNTAKHTLKAGNTSLMQSSRSRPERSIRPDFRFPISGYSWSSLPERSTIVDFDGSEGNTSIAIAKSYPRPKEVDEGIEFMAHEFTNPQTREGECISSDRFFMTDPIGMFLNYCGVAFQ